MGDTDGDSKYAVSRNIFESEIDKQFGGESTMQFKKFKKGVWHHYHVLEKEQCGLNFRYVR